MNLPKPAVIMYCGHCDDVTEVGRDKHGQYCGNCYRPLHMCKKKP